jgi:hypothetical protein
MTQLPAALAAPNARWRDIANQVRRSGDRPGAAPADDDTAAVKWRAISPSPSAAGYSVECIFFGTSGFRCLMLPWEMDGTRQAQHHRRAAHR